MGLPIFAKALPIKLRETDRQNQMMLKKEGVTVQEPTRAAPETAWSPLQLQQPPPRRRQSHYIEDCQGEKDGTVRHPPTLSTKLKNSLQPLKTGMTAEAVADRSGSGLTNATIEQTVVLDTELHVWLEGDSNKEEDPTKEMGMASDGRKKDATENEKTKGK